jgi:hypothetical protein
VAIDSDMRWKKRAATLRENFRIPWMILAHYSAASTLLNIELA